MNNFPSHAHVVVIGAGIVGNSMVYHLAKLGWRDIVLLDKGPLPNPGGSTGHASNFIYLVDHSKEMTKFTLDSVKQYKELGVFTTSGGIEVSRTPERVEELKRRITSGKSWGIEGMHLISPAEVKQLVPFINEKIILSGFYTEGIGTVDSLRGGTLMREAAQTMGALQVFPNTEITGMQVEPTPGSGKRIRAVETTKGAIQAEIVIITCGLWSPRLARMAGAYIPLTPAVHQMISVGPVPQLMDTVGEIKYPIIRDMDTNMYERQHGSDMEVGSYAHRPILWEPDDVPSIEKAALSPTEAPFTKEDFDPQLEQALELIPDILGNEQVGIRYAINGLLSLTPDGFPVLGETPEVKGLWSVAAIWIKEAPGIARAVAEWMTDGNPEIDPSGSDIARFYPHQKTKTHVKARSAEGFNKTYGIVHPREQWNSNRNVRLSPYYEREKVLGAVFYEAMGWERPTWYESNAKLLDEFGDRVGKRDAEWDARWWSPIINAEHLAMRERVGMVDLSAFAIFDVQGAGALDFIQKMAVNQMDTPIGRVTYTNFLNAHGGIKADLTIMRLGENYFRVVTGAFDGARDKKWLIDHLPAGPEHGEGPVTLTDVTSAWSTLGVWGPKAREVLQSITEADFSDKAFPFATCQWVDFGTVNVLASRISYVGELGWELYVPFEQGARLWDMVREAGQKFGIAPVGIGVYAVTGRLEKSYRLYGAELEQEYNLVEAGMARAKVKEQDFIGKAAYMKQRANPPAALLCSLTVDDNTSASGIKRFMQGREPILTLDGGPIEDARGRRSYVTSAGAGPTLGKYILMSYLPPAYAKVGTKLKVEYFGEQYPVTVAAVGATPLLDPENKRIKG
ncbi:MAG: FAD-dependent oxidoreductase [Chloroflexi bacterium]|nr:FAD-dependent oxidoreductase [Chloroflexota bacterium]